MEIWKKSGSNYEKLMEKDYSTGIDHSQVFYMEKGTDYYIYMGGVKGCNADLTLGGAGTIYAYDADINEPASYKVLSEKKLTADQCGFSRRCAMAEIRSPRRWKI